MPYLMFSARSRVPLLKKRERDKTCACYIRIDMYGQVAAHQPKCGVSTCLFEGNFGTLLTPKVHESSGSFFSDHIQCKEPHRYALQKKNSCGSILPSEIGEFVDLQRNVYSGHTTIKFLEEIKALMGDFSGRKERASTVQRRFSTELYSRARSTR